MARIGRHLHDRSAAEQRSRSTATRSSGQHELKFGFGWRKATVDSSDTYSGNGVITIHIGYPDMIAKITRPGHALTDAVYTSAYGGDT